MSMNKNRQVRRQFSDEVPYTSTPSGSMAPPVLDFQTLHKGGKRVIRRVPSSPSDSNEAGADPDEVDRQSSTSSSPQTWRIIRHSSQSQPHQANRRPSARGRGAHHSGIPRPSQQVNRQEASSSPEKVKSKSEARDPPSQQERAEGPSMEKKPRSPTKKPRRRRSRNTAESEIQRLQRGTDLLIPRRCFSRMVRQVMSDIDERRDIRWQGQALEALQEACEYFLVQLFEVSQGFSLHARRITLIKKDLQLARRVWAGF